MMSYTMNKASRHLALTLGAGAVSALLLIATGALAGGPAFPQGAEITDWSQNGQNGRYLLEMLDGNLPAPGETFPGTVISDTSCAPDAEGINHCHNEIELSDGTTVTGINNHKMMVNRCLKPGDAVSLAYFADGWGLVTLANE